MHINDTIMDDRRSFVLLRLCYICLSNEHTLLRSMTYLLCRSYLSHFMWRLTWFGRWKILAKRVKWPPGQRLRDMGVEPNRARPKLLSFRRNAFLPRISELHVPVVDATEISSNTGPIFDLAQWLKRRCRRRLQTPSRFVDLDLARTVPIGINASIIHTELLDGAAKPQDQHQSGCMAGPIANEGLQSNSCSRVDPAQHHRHGSKANDSQASMSPSFCKNLVTSTGSCQWREH